MGFDGVDEMRGVSCGEIFHAKIVDAESERGALRAMAPEAWGKWHGFVSGRFQFLDELVEGEDAGFFEAIHAVTAFEVDSCSRHRRWEWCIDGRPRLLSE